MSDAGARLDGTSVIVTGGGRGLGRAMTEALVGAGASVLVIDLDREPIDELRKEVTGNISAFVGDVSSEEDVEAAVEQCISEFGRVDVVVNNAGIGMSSLQKGVDPVRFFEVDPSSFREFFEVHVMGPFLLSTVALPHLVGQGFGRIVTVTTSLWHMLPGGNTPYGPVKAASESLTSAMAADLDGTGVTANVLVPGGGADTRFVKDIPGRSRDHLIKPVVMGPPVVFLASTDSNGVSARRIIAKDWDPTLPEAEALAQSSTQIGWPGSH